VRTEKVVNYGYDCQGWSEAAKNELADELRKLVANVRDRNGRQPEVEVNGTYGGVRIRKLTWLTEEQIDKLTIDADAIVDKIAKKTIINGVGPQPLFMSKVERAIRNRAEHIAREKGLL
jgi:CxxC motif-containing protein